MLAKHTSGMSLHAALLTIVALCLCVCAAVALSAVERQVYMSTHRKASELWHAVRSMSPAAINQRILQIMALLVPLRRICSGGQIGALDLALPAKLESVGHVLNAYVGLAAGGGSGAVATDASLVVPDQLECSICLDNFDSPVSKH